MKGLATLLLLTFAIGTGCSYGGVGLNASGDRAVIARNDNFLFGALRKVVVCKVDDGGLHECVSAETP